MAYFGAKDYVDTVEILKGVKNRFLSIIFFFCQYYTFWTLQEKFEAFPKPTASAQRQGSKS